MSGYDERQVATRQGNTRLNRALQDLGATVTVTPEWEVVFGLLDGGWPGTPTDADRLAYMTFLNDLDHRTIARALRQRAKQGQRYRPTPAEVRAAIPDEPLTHTPDTDEAWQQVLGLARPRLNPHTAAMWIDPLVLAGELDRALVVDAADPVLAWVKRRYLALLSATAREVTSYTGVMVLSALPGKWCAAPPALHAVAPPPDQLAEGTS